MGRVYCIGDRVLNADRSCSGTIRWIGKLNVDQIRYISEKNAKTIPFGGNYKEGADSGTEVVNGQANFIDAEEIYLGIEWDDDLKGYCNGEIYDIKIFEPIYSNIRNHYRNKFSDLAHSQILSCSFVPLSNFSSVHKDFFQAVVERYVDDTGDNGFNNDIQFVGRQEAIDYFRDLNNLRIMGVNGYGVSIIGHVDNVCFPKIQRIEIVDNLISSWEEIIKISKFAPNLSILDMSGNKMLQSNLSLGKHGSFESLKTLYLNRTFIQFEELANLFYYRIFPKLESIHLCDNYISSFFIGKDCNLPCLHTMNLSNNYISDLEVVFKLVHDFPTLKKLIITGNKISAVRSTQALVNYRVYPHSNLVDHLEELYIEDNLINDWDIIIYFSHKFPELKSLRITRNPLKYINEKNSNSLRIILISLFPKLEILDGSNISKSERTDSECFFISMSNSRHGSYELINKIDSTILNRLEQIHGKRECVNEDLILGQSFIQLTLVPEGELCDFSKGINKRVFSTNSIVRDIKAVCSKIFNVEYSMVKLIYNVKNLHVPLELDDDFARIDQYGLSDDQVIRVQHPISL